MGDARAAGGESTMTATASTQPVIMYRSDDDRSSSVRAASDGLYDD